MTVVDALQIRATPSGSIALHPDFTHFVYSLLTHKNIVPSLSSFIDFFTLSSIHLSLLSPATMGRIFRCVLAASALLQPLGAGVNATPLHAEPISNNLPHALSHFPGDLRSSANLARAGLSATFANAASRNAMNQRLHSTSYEKALHLEDDQDPTSVSLNHQKRAPAALQPGNPLGWNYLGCFAGADSIDTAINYGFYWNPEGGVQLPAPQLMSASICTASCSLNGRYLYAGLNENTCYCFDEEPANSTTAPTCDTPCYNNEEEVCGGNSEDSAQLTVFTRGEATNVVPRPVDPAPDQWEYTGCFSLEGYAYVALADGYSTGYNNTEGVVDVSAELCTAECNDNGYWIYAGVMANGCFCSNNGPISGTKFPEEYCQAQCPAHPDQTCGGLQFTNWYLTIYNRQLQLNPPDEVPYTDDGPWYYKGCYALGEEFFAAGGKWYTYELHARYILTSNLFYCRYLCQGHVG